MSKVIRISDSIFRRLQHHAEPLVDTPAKVIERLLDHYENQHPEEAMSPPPEVHDSGTATPSVNLFLAPASRENVQLTIEDTVSFQRATRHLTSAQLNKVRHSLGGENKFHCWAMTESNRATFDSMQPGDIVLLSVRGTGQFNYRGQVRTKIESEALGNTLWSITPGRPWKLIYIMSDVDRIEIDKPELVSTLGYAENYAVPGVIRVDPQRIRTVCDIFGSIEEMLDSLSE